MDTVRSSVFILAAGSEAGSDFWRAVRGDVAISFPSRLKNPRCQFLWLWKDRAPVVPLPLLSVEMPCLGDTHRGCALEATFFGLTLLVELW